MSVLGTAASSFNKARKGQRTLDVGSDVGRLDGAMGYVGRGAGKAVDSVADMGRGVVSAVGGVGRAAALSGVAAIGVFGLFVWALRYTGMM